MNAINRKQKIKNMELISYGRITENFKTIAQLKDYFNKIKNKEIPSNRLDCYPTDKLNVKALSAIINKFTASKLDMPKDWEIFYPSDSYPSHTDEGGTSYFIGLESGNFTIGDISYPIVPYVLYSFEDSKLHNTDFGAIMLK
ncbi:hypothetical protein Phi4:1_gp014 [Cellulophaga phage phi4:1]|uniref:Uncharacterized protein n=5 Tax=Lightbulbvirus TaxID=1918522 RepID=A0A0S2MWH6_9CAUD|nr:hypothetical protein Phi4:1_gp014 [Cellulophaga phage phi4:1]YP_008241509.1 hypothetical protein Phi17:2_gp014 [Cellulophaga phage phi17:2]ALO80023.1 hypothetical protein Phi4113_014 [Cellulophaga phage phi4:1_13]ALO80220.1 hypothetical protein Phi4118_014 [Cellulophaga phage phi4:1_18]ALO80417.1 hypothetical protein Phi17218_014 [Cellulophaga phage phi17:2_18]AGO47547.1 hypothetical protein Phi17:2_gp014 [Cellulophaga phage phi17:2]AGO49427.1 hypothetical protein Phi4:1_gp014 [Cellulophag